MTLDPDFRIYDFLPPDIREKVDNMFIATRNKNVWRIKTYQLKFTKRTYTYKEALKTIKKLCVGWEVYYEKNLNHYAYKYTRIRSRRKHGKKIIEEEYVRLANAFSSSIPEIEQVAEIISETNNDVYKL